MMERTTVIGRLGRDPRRKSTSKGEVTDFSLAASSRVLGPDGRWSDGPTTWYEVSAWDRLAENAAVSLQKGQPVLVHGVITTDHWTDRDGVSHDQLRIKAASIGHDLSSGTTSFARSAPTARTQVPSEESAATGQPAASVPPADPIGWNTPMATAPASSAAQADAWTTLVEAEETPF